MGEIRLGNEDNDERFRECTSSVLVEAISRQNHAVKPKSKSKRQAARRGGLVLCDTDVDADKDGDLKGAADDLADFIEYIASETYKCLPPELQTITYHTWTDNAALRSRYPLPVTHQRIPVVLPSLDPSIADSLVAYGIASPDGLTTDIILARVLTEYLTASTAQPPPPSVTRRLVSACEICGRDWVNLTYHHLIPRMVHAKVVKRGWHRPDELQNVAWLCGACHRFVHHFAGHEDLARRFYTVELLLEQEDVVAFAKWVGRLRWKGGRTGKK
jgi:hypothetical protein